jgi:hypothetical protein
MNAPHFVQVPLFILLPHNRNTTNKIGKPKRQRFNSNNKPNRK